MSFWINDKDKGISTYYWVYLEVSLDFDSSWTGSEVEICKKYKFRGWSEEVKGCRRWIGPMSLEWVTSTRCFVAEDKDILVWCGEGDDGITSVIAGWEDVKALAGGADYQDGIARLEIKQDFPRGASTVRLTVRKEYDYDGAEFFKLSVVVENIHRDEWNELLDFKDDHGDVIDEHVPCTWQGNECVIEQTPVPPWRNNRSDIINDVRNVALESLPLIFKYLDAEAEAAQRGLSYDDFQWEFPNHHETRIVRHPSAHTDTPLRALRLDLWLAATIDDHSNQVGLYVPCMELNVTAITRSPSFPNNLSSCTLRLDTPYAALANATIPNHPSQIIELSPDSQSAGRVITTSGTIHVNNTVQIMGPVMGDMFAAPIYGGNVGGQNNTNHFTASPTVEEVFSVVMKAMEARTKRRRVQVMYGDDAGVDVEPPRKRRARRSRA
ncbi:hypothetical protein AB1N83_011094 [Pleurotus pulmonarius]